MKDSSETISNKPANVRVAITGDKADIRGGFHGRNGAKVNKKGVVQKCTAYACIGVDLDGQKDVLNDINSTFGKHK